MPIRKLSTKTVRKHKGVSFVGVSVSFICYDEEGRVFFAKRSRYARDEHGRWDCGGGGLKHGERILDTLARELAEEYNVQTLLHTTPLGQYEVFRELADGTPTHWLTLPFAVKVNPTEVRIMEPRTFDGAGWFRLDALPRPLHSAWESHFPPEFWKQLRTAITTHSSGVY